MSLLFDALHIAAGIIIGAAIVFCWIMSKLEVWK